MDTLSIHLLGGFRIFYGTTPIPDHAWRLRKAQVLVQLLALAPQYARHREQVMELLWPNLTLDAAARNLHQVMHFARRALSDPFRGSKSRSELPNNNPQILVVRRQVIRLQPTVPLWVDVTAFEQAAVKARQSRSPTDYQRAIALYEGDLLPESPYDDVFAERRFRLKDLLLTLQLEKAGLDEAAGAWDQAIETYQNVLANDPAIEPAVAGLLRCCKAMDARDLAARIFHAYVKQIREELGLEPGPELLRMYQQFFHHDDGGTHYTSSPLTRTAGSRIQSQPVIIKPSANRTTAATGVMPLVGRDGELRTLINALKNADQGSIFLITGEPGIGKSRLAREACQHASIVAGLPISVGIAFGAGETPPFGPWRQALREYGARTGRSLTNLPEPIGQGPPARSAQDLALDVADYLAAGPPALFVFEDLQWFDPASNAMLLHGLSRFSLARLHFLITCRTHEIRKNQRLRQLTEAILGSGGQLINLYPLDKTGIQALARAAGHPERAEEVYARSGGNPFFACHLLAAPESSELPWTIEQAVTERLRALRTTTVELLRIGAILGLTFHMEILQKAAGQAPDLVADALQEAYDHGIVHPRGNGYAFAHDLIRQVLVASLSPEDRRLLHLRASTAVVDPDAAAYHLGEAGDPRAVPWLLAAGRRMMHWGAVEQAHRHFERSLQLAAGDDPLRPELLLLLAVRTDPNEVVAQADRLRQAISEAEIHGDTVVAGLARRLLAEIYLTQNDGQALELLDQSVKELETVVHDARFSELEQLVDRRILLYPGWTTLTYALLRHNTGTDIVSAVQSVVSWRKMQMRIHEDQWAEAFAHMLKGDVRKSIEALLAAGERAMTIRNYLMATWCFGVAANTEFWQCGTDRALIQSTVDRMREAAQRARERLGTDPFPKDHFMLPYWFWYGHWDRVRQVYDLYAADGAKLDTTIAVFTFVYGLEVVREQGDPAAALSAYSALLPPGGPGSPPGLLDYIPQMAYITFAIRTMIAAGELEMARAWLETMDAWHRGPRPNPVIYSWALIAWAEWHRSRGDLEAMRRIAGAALEMTRQVPGTWVELNALRLLGAAGGPKAPDHLARALDLAHRCGFPFEVARTRLDRGLPQDLIEARRIFEKLNARSYLRRIDQLTSDRRN